MICRLLPYLQLLQHLCVRTDVRDAYVLCMPHVALMPCEAVASMDQKVGMHAFPTTRPAILCAGGPCPNASVFAMATQAHSG